jgi:uncharacterized membrane protein YccC
MSRVHTSLAAKSVMASTAPLTGGRYEESLRRGQVKHGLKTALACCLATGLSYVFRLPSGQLAVVFAYLIMTMGMPSPRLNWLLAQIAIVISALVSALILVALGDVLLLYLAATLLWIFFCMLFSNWFALPATLGAMVSALGIFVFFDGTVGDALSFYVGYGANFLIGGFSVVVVDTLLWPFTTRKILLRRLAEVYSHLERECRRAAAALRSGESPSAETSSEAWAPFRSLRKMLAPELRRAHDTSNPFARMILACRSLNLRLWFLNRDIVPMLAAASSAPARQESATVLDRAAEQLHSLLEGALLRRAVPPLDLGTLGKMNLPHSDAGQTEALLSHGIHTSLFHRLGENLLTATESHNALVASFRRGLAGELDSLSPSAKGKSLFSIQSVRSAAKLDVILILLLLEESFLRIPGGTQVAFFATFFASTSNLGRQNKTDLVGLAGLLGGFAYGVVAAFFTSRMPYFPLLLALVFLGEFVANIVYQRLPRFGAAGLQAGLAIPFAYLATTGPEWGSFATVRTRFAGLVVAGFTAVVVHAYLWPVLPVRELRSSIAAALRATAASLAQLFGSTRADWEGSPPSLGATVTRARDLIDDARYLPGSERADPAYDGVLRSLQEIDANLEYIHFLIGLEAENPLRRRFFQVFNDYAEQAGSNLETVARQFERTPRRAAAIDPVHWAPEASRRWERAAGDIASVADEGIDPWRPAVIARCLDHVARAVENISTSARQINLRNAGR